MLRVASVSRDQVTLADSRRLLVSIKAMATHVPRVHGRALLVINAIRRRDFGESGLGDPIVVRATILRDCDREQFFNACTLAATPSCWSRYFHSGPGERTGVEDGLGVASCELRRYRLRSFCWTPKMPGSEGYLL
jgi:hypothetical protein